MCVCVFIHIDIPLLTYVHCFVVLKEGGHTVVGREVAMTSGRQNEEKVDITNPLCELVVFCV